MRRGDFSSFYEFPGGSRSAAEVRIRVTHWREVAPVEGQFIERPRSPRMVWQYLQHVGPLAVARKVASRLAERNRNCKIAGIGLGVVCEAPQDSRLEPGDPVGFFAPNHPANPHWLVLDRRFVLRTKEVRFDADPAGASEALDELSPYVGWSPFSGVTVDSSRFDGALKRALTQTFSKGDLPAPAKDDGAFSCHVPERIERSGNPGNHPTAVLFGLGNYAKVQIVPHIRRSLDLACVHEVDPAQIEAARRWGAALDTSPWPREDEAYDAWFIAGFHHTHAPIAAEALRRGGYAVVEKPLATTWDQLGDLEAVLDQTEESRLVAGFQRRYTPMNDWARADLGVHSGEPINYYCIVYEIPLPGRHWYNWPNSGSRLTSNGCHWIDHFLFLNGYPGLADYRVHRAGNGDLFVVMEADNGASFSMVLTEQGSERLGVRDYVELRANGVTVRMVDQARYESESSLKRIRRRRLNPTRAYARLYEAAVETVLNRGSGDDPRSLESTRATLLLEDALAAEAPLPAAGGSAQAEPPSRQPQSLSRNP